MRELRLSYLLKLRKPVSDWHSIRPESDTSPYFAFTLSNIEGGSGKAIFMECYVCVMHYAKYLTVLYHTCFPKTHNGDAITPHFTDEKTKA